MYNVICYYVFRILGVGYEYFGLIVIVKCILLIHIVSHKIRLSIRRGDL